jgi:hypothetical protein
LLTDLGAEFDSDITHELCCLMCIDKIRCTVCRPQANGQLERFHRILNEYLAVIRKSRKAKPFTVNMDKLKLVLNDQCGQSFIHDGVAAPAIAEKLYEAEDKFMQQRPKRAISKPKFMHDYCCRCVETLAYRNRRVMSSDDDCADQDVRPQVPPDQPTQRRRVRRLQSTFHGRPTAQIARWHSAMRLLSTPDRVHV